MKTGTIKSEIDLKRSPYLALVLSIFFTGLGQIYNGDIFIGIIFFLLKILSIILPFVFIILKGNEYIIYNIALAVLFFFLIWVISSFEAVYTAKKNISFNLKKYNNIYFYITFGFLNAGLFIGVLFLMNVLFTVEKISNNYMEPTFLKGEYVIVNKYSIKDIDIGDVIFYKDKETEKVSRIIAKERETFRYENNIFFINDSKLPLGILENYMIENLNIKNSADVFYEENGKKKYMIKVPISDSRLEIKKGKKKIPAQLMSRPILIKSNMVLLSNDNRTTGNPNQLINTKNLRGKVEGILVSSKFSRILLRPFITMN